MNIKAEERIYNHNILLFFICLLMTTEKYYIAFEKSILILYMMVTILQSTGEYYSCNI